MIEDKVARVCWNTNYWQKPSGMDGKVNSSQSGAYEKNTGYGHEEWLLDSSKIIDGYHYSYIQAIGQHRDKYIGSEYNIALYSINSKTKDRWWLGEIKNVMVVDQKESARIHKEYKKRGWLDEMYQQIMDVNADLDEFKSIAPENFTCIKYKLSNLKILDEPRKFSANDPAITSDYYNLKNRVNNPVLESQEFDFEPGHREGKKKTSTSYKGRNTEINLLHNQIQTSIYNQFIKKYGEKNVGTEQKTGSGTKIDIVVKNKNKFTFYEIKTGNSVRGNIREALSQLMEYAYFPNEKRASKLIIVTPKTCTKDSREYLKKLRDNFNIPVFYQRFNVESEKLEKD